MRSEIQKAAETLRRSRRTVALTGAGISVESGIPPFRGPGGVWERLDPMEFAHIDRFMENPEKVWRVLILELKAALDAARPNDGHKGLARLEAMSRLSTVITQNVDGLHQAAGNTDVIEFHGTFARLQCLNCAEERHIDTVDLSHIPPRCDCGGIFRPACIFYGELIPPVCLARSQQLSAECEVMLVVGTSATVQPAASMPLIAKQNGAVIIEVNPAATPLTFALTDHFLQGNAGVMMNRLLEEMDGASH